ncbi:MULTISPECIES: Maf family protein [Paenibacillus]|uniref:Maf family protein n=1 Tax=Paenibacillus TaxID=44249 RepID=UPI0011A688DD|nr:Maf family protein [Paenibacillus sp. IHBB 10380]
MKEKRNRRIILASTSPRRQELIASLRIPFDIVPSEANEDTPAEWSPDRIVESLALRKAEAVHRKLNTDQGGGIIVGSDTVVVLEDLVLGKPVDHDDAVRMLTMLQGRAHRVFTGVACIDLASGAIKVSHRETKVSMKRLSPDAVEAYVRSGEPMDKAGDYDTTMHLGDIGQYRVLSQSPSGQPEVIVGHTVSKVTFRPMSDAEIEAYVKTGEPLDKAGSYGAQGLGAVFIEKIEGDFFSIMGLPLNLLYQMLLKFGISPFQEK